VRGPLLPGIEMLEALKLRVLDGDTQLGLLFLAHGHQGMDLSDRGAGLSRLVLRWIWWQIENRGRHHAWALGVPQAAQTAKPSRTPPEVGPVATATRSL
jgi:hypothetical protein